MCSEPQPQCGGESPAREPVAKVLSRVRHTLNMTQVAFAVSLCVSPKAVQSYEQGWRKVPRDILNQALALLAEYRRRTTPDAPCWTLSACLDPRRAACPSFLLGTGGMCWSLGARDCRIHQRRNGDVDTNCPVIRRLFDGAAE